jgi:4-aminobutyrate aminotransferase
MARPKIVVKPPGPKACKVLARDRKVSSPSMARVYPLVIQRASGVNVWDVDGNRFLDMNSGIAVMNLGHSHPRIVRAIEKQARKASHAAYLEFYPELPTRFIEELLSFTPGFDQCFLTNSGAESVEAAMKLARFHTKRKYFLAFYGAFHGRTLGALSLTASKVVHRKDFGPFYPVIHVPYCNPSHCLLNHSTHSGPGDCARAHLDYIENVVFQNEVSPEEIAAIFVEPIQGEGGYILPPTEFIQGLRKICDKHGILFVDDEVQTGYYRTGRFLAIEHFGVKPDIVCMAKGLGAGLPLGAVLSTSKIMDWPPGSHASTFGGNLLSCAAALEGLRLCKELDLESTVPKKGAWVLDYFRDKQRRVDRIGDVRGLGLMIGIEIANLNSKVPSSRIRDKIVNYCFEQGVCFLPAGDSAIRIAPPLIIQQADLQYGAELLMDAIKKLS